MRALAGRPKPEMADAARRGTHRHEERGALRDADGRDDGDARSASWRGTRRSRSRAGGGWFRRNQFRQPPRPWKIALPRLPRLRERQPHPRHRLPKRLRRNEARVDPEPSEAQKESGNYRKGHVKVQGLDITIENPKGSERSGRGPDGEEWSVTMPATYGYVKGTKGADADQVDVYVGEDMAAPQVFVVDQVDADDQEVRRAQSIPRIRRRTAGPRDLRLRLRRRPRSGAAAEAIDGRSGGRLQGVAR